MRLIDADVLIKAIQQHMVKINSLFEEEKTVVEIIDAQPTAYDVEKVSDEIKAQFGCRDCEYADVSPTPYVCLGECAELEVINDICDIVKRGGVE